MKIIEYLGRFSDEEINRVGAEKCALVADYVKKKGPDPTVEAFFKNPRLSSETTVNELGRSRNLEVRKTAAKVVCGEALEPSFRGLTYAPVSEQGVVFLFGMVCNELGFRVESVRQRYPDCIAKEKIRDGKAVKWQTVKIEFELTSKDFIRHGHSPEHADIIVCWKDDLSPSQRTSYPRVLELRSEIEKLRH